MTDLRRPATSASYPSGSGSAISIGGHPLHAMLVPLPIASLLGAFATDLAFVSTLDTFWSRMSFTLLAAGLVTGALAGLVGLIEALSLQRARSAGRTWAHAGINVLVLIMTVANFKIRWESDALWSPPLVYLSGAVAGLLLVSGWLGGSMAYRHGIGVSEHVGSARAPGDPERTPDGRPDVPRGA